MDRRRMTIVWLWHRRNDENKFSFPVIFTCDNDTVTTVMIKKISNLIAFSLTNIFLFNSKIFLSIKPVLDTQYCVHTFNSRFSLSYKQAFKSLGKKAKQALTLSRHIFACTIFREWRFLQMKNAFWVVF